MQPLLAIVTGWFGPLDGAEAALAPVRALSPVADLAGPLPYVALQSLVDEIVPHGWQRYWKSGYFTDCPNRSSTASPRPTTASRRRSRSSCSSTSTVRSTRSAWTDTAFPTARRPGTSTCIAEWTEPEQAEAGVAWARGIWDEIAPSAAASTSTTSTPTTGAGSRRPTGRTRAARQPEAEVRPRQLLPHEQQHRARLSRVARRLPSSAMPSEVRAVVSAAVKEPGHIETIVVPDPGPGEALVKVQACSRDRSPRGRASPRRTVSIDLAETASDVDHEVHPVQDEEAYLPVRTQPSEDRVRDRLPRHHVEVRGLGPG